MTTTRFVSTIALVALALIGCASDEIAPPTGLTDPGLSNVKTDNVAARASTIDHNGGSIVATGSNGVVYTLTVPPEALDSAVEIRMYPITSITGFPLAGNVKGGVHLEPEGFVPSASLTLTIAMPTAADPASTAVIASKGNANGFHAFPTVVNGQTLSLLLTHFSQYSVGDATLDELLEVRGHESDATESYLHRLATAYLTTTNNMTLRDAEYRAVMSGFYTNVVVPSFTTLESETVFETMRIDLTHAIGDYDAWRAAINFCSISGSSTIDVTQHLDDSKLRAGRALRNGLTVSRDHLTALAGDDPNGPSDLVVNDMTRDAIGAMSIQQFAERWDVDLAAFGLELETVLNSLPIKVAIQSMSMPGNVGPGSGGVLTIRAGIKILDRAVRVSPAVRLELSNLGSATATPLQGMTDASGNFRSTVFWPLGLQTLRIDMLGSVVTGLLRVPELEIRVFDRFTREATPQPMIGVWRDDELDWLDDAFGTDGLRLTANLQNVSAQSTGGGIQSAFTIPITWTANNRFSGNGKIPETAAHFMFAGWSITASGEVLNDGTLNFTWSASTTNNLHTGGSHNLPRER